MMGWLGGGLLYYQMSNANSRSRVQGIEPGNQQGNQLQYISEYDSYGYMPPAAMLNQHLQHSTAIREGYHMGPSGNVLSGPSIGSERVKSESSRLVSSQVRNEQVVKGESRVSYVPYEKKVVEYENRTYVEKVPIKRKVITYEERKVIQTVPREVVKQDYYAVEKRIQYYKEIIPEKKIEMVPVERKVKRYEYVPVEKQIVHYPENVDLETAKGQSRVVLGSQGVQVKSDAEYRPINPALIYNYSARPESQHNPIGYVDQGHSRVFSNSPTFIVQQEHPYAQQPDHLYGLQPAPSPSYMRTQSAQRFETSRVFSPRQVEGESYIKELSTLGKTELKRPFQLLEQSGNHAHLQRGSREQQKYEWSQAEGEMAKREAYHQNDH